MRKAVPECKHKWRSVGRDLDYCPKCKSYQLSMGWEVESHPKQKKTLQPNQIVPMLHR